MSCSSHVRSHLPCSSVSCCVTSSQMSHHHDMSCSEFLGCRSHHHTYAPTSVPGTHILVRMYSIATHTHTHICAYARAAANSEPFLIVHLGESFVGESFVWIWSLFPFPLGGPSWTLSPKWGPKWPLESNQRWSKLFLQWPFSNGIA